MIFCRGDQNLKLRHVVERPMEYARLWRRPMSCHGDLDRR